MTQHSPEQVLVTRIAFTTNPSETSQLSFETYVERDADVAEYHKIIDRLQAAAERQRAKSRAIQLQFELEGLEKQLCAQIGDLAERQAAFEEAEGAARDRHVESNRRGEFRPTASEISVIRGKKIDLDKTRVTVEGFKWRAEKLKEQIAEYERISA